MSRFLLGTTVWPLARMKICILCLRASRMQMSRLQQAGYAVISWCAVAPQMTRAPERIGLHVGVTFDDGYDSDFESAGFLHSIGYHALFFIATEYIGRCGYLDRSCIPELQRLGMGSVRTHSLAPLDDQQMNVELAQSKHVLEDIVQRPIKHLSFPGDYRRRAGYEYFFTSDCDVNTEKHRLTVFLSGVDQGACVTTIRAS